MPSPGYLWPPAPSVPVCKVGQKCKKRTPPRSSSWLITNESWWINTPVLSPFQRDIAEVCVLEYFPGVPSGIKFQLAEVVTCFPFSFPSISMFPRISLQMNCLHLIQDSILKKPILSSWSWQEVIKSRVGLHHEILELDSSSDRST